MLRLLTRMALGERKTSAAGADFAQPPQQRRQNLDRVPAPGGKIPRRDYSRPHPACSPTDETHTRLSKKDRKLQHRQSRLRPEREIHLVKGSLATRPQFPVKLRSQLLRHLLGDGRNFSPKGACRRVRRSTARLPELCRQLSGPLLPVSWKHRALAQRSLNCPACSDTSRSRCAR